MTTATTPRRGPQRPPTPNSKGLADAITMPVRIPTDAAKFLRDRAAYETLKFRIENNGKGRAISSQDIIRRLIDAYRKKTPATPDDTVGRAIKSTI